MISTSLMTLGETINRAWTPATPQFSNYVEAWTEAKFAKYFINSVVITAITVLGQLVVSILAGYGFARIKFF
jgi:ABC-type glycerol-3-phosphate transport system permease component